MQTTRKKLMVFAAALLWLFCGAFSQMALTAFAAPTTPQNIEKICIVEAAKLPCCVADKSSAASTRAMICPMESAADFPGAKTSASSLVPCRCEAPHAPLPATAQNARASSDDLRRTGATVSPSLLAPRISQLSFSTSRAFTRRFERVKARARVLLRRRCQAALRRIPFETPQRNRDSSLR